MEATYTSNYWNGYFPSTRPATQMPEWSESLLEQRSRRASLQPHKHAPTRSHQTRRETLVKRRARSPYHQPPWQTTAAFSQAPAPAQSPWYHQPELPPPVISQVTDRAESPRYSPGSPTTFFCDLPAAPTGAQSLVFRPEPLSPLYQSPAPFVPETPTPRTYQHQQRNFPKKRLALSYIINPQDKQLPPPPQSHQQWAFSHNEVESIVPQPMAPALTSVEVEATISRWESDHFRKERERAQDLRRRVRRPWVHWESPLRVSPDHRSPSPRLLTLTSNERLQRLVGPDALRTAEDQMENHRLQCLVRLQQKQLDRLDREQQQSNAGRYARLCWL